MDKQLIYLLCAAIAPVIAGLGYIFAKDRYNKEPFGMLLGAFFLGVISIIPIGIIELILMVIFNNPQSGLLSNAFWNAFIVAACTEECIKLLILYYFIWNSPEFDERFDGIVYGVFVSLGFACAENIGYILNSLSEGGVFFAYYISAVRAIFSIPCHFFCGVILGYYLSLAKFEKVNQHNSAARKNTIYKGLFYAILFHGIFDFILFYSASSCSSMNQETTDFSSESALSGLATFIVFIVFNILFWKRGNKHINHLASLLRENPKDEPSAFVTCSNCGEKYASNLTSCPSCKQLTEKTILAQSAPDNDLNSQNLQKLNDLFSNLEDNSSPKNPFDM